MKLGDAMSGYRKALNEYNAAGNSILKRKNDLQKSIETMPDQAESIKKQMVTLEISYNAVKEKQDQYQKYMNQLTDMWNMYVEEKSSEENAEAVKDSFDDYGKILEVARRISRGDTVPPEDEKKLMEYSSDLYQAAVSAGMQARMQNRKHKDYDSLWSDEDKKPEQEDPMEYADNQTISTSSAPAIADVSATLDSAVSGENQGE